MAADCAVAVSRTRPGSQLEVKQSYVCGPAHEGTIMGTGRKQRTSTSARLRGAGLRWVAVLLRIPDMASMPASRTGTRLQTPGGSGYPPLAARNSKSRNIGSVGQRWLSWGDGPCCLHVHVSCLLCCCCMLCVCGLTRDGVLEEERAVTEVAAEEVRRQVQVSHVERLQHTHTHTHNNSSHTRSTKQQKHENKQTNKKVDEHHCTARCCPTASLAAACVPTCCPGASTA